MFLVRNLSVLLCLLLLASCSEKKVSSTTESKNIDSVIILPVIKTVNYFSAKTSESKDFSTSDMKDIPTVVYFMFTTCKGPCPIINKQTETLISELNIPVRFVAITVDPETDTESKLLEYSKSFSYKKNSWFFIRTNPDSLRSIAVNNFMVGDIESPMVHSTRYILVDKNAKIRGYYDGLDSKAVDKLKIDLKSIDTK